VKAIITFGHNGAGAAQQNTNRRKEERTKEKCD
jgi:hypothetical protein